MLQSFNHLLVHFLTDQHVHVSLVAGSPALDTALQIRLSKAEGKDHLSACWHFPAWCSPREGTLLAHGQPYVHQEPQALLGRAASQSVGPSIFRDGVCLSPRAWSGIPGDSFWPISVSSPVKVILNASISIWCIFFQIWD